MGVLVGTALIVIIPEGVETLYSASDYSADAQNRRNIIPHASVAQRDVEGLHTLNLRAISLADESPDTNPYNALPGPVLPEDTEMQQVDSDAHPKTPPVTPTEPGKVGILDDEPSTISAPSLEKPETTTGSRQGKPEPHAWIGLSLICGFILMYLLDTLPFLAPPAPARPHSNIYSLSDLSTSPPPTPATPQRSMSTTLGLCIHAAADGIALGASSSSTSTTSLSLIIFVAIMVHKAPAAFGLTSVLLKQGLGKRAARAHLVIFSLAAPVGAVGTWVVVRALGGGGNTEPGLMKWWTGVLLLFSGGTFLWVAPTSDGPGAVADNRLGQICSNAHNARRRQPKRRAGGRAKQRLFRIWRARVTSTKGRQKSTAGPRCGWRDAFAADHSDRTCTLMY